MNDEERLIKRESAASALSAEEQAALEKDRAKLMTMQCDTAAGGFAVLAQVLYMVKRYGQEACIGEERPDDGT